MAIPCFLGKAESNIVKECSEEPGMECLRGPVVFPHLLAVKSKQKNPSNRVLLYICLNSYLYRKNDLQELLLPLNK